MEYYFGQVFQRGDYFYLLSQVDHWKVALIELKNGNRWHTPLAVGKPRNISPKEFDKITNGEKFTLVGKKIDEVYCRNTEATQHKVGQIYQGGNYNYILCRVDPFLRGLISLTAGNRWNNPVEVSHAYFINPFEFDEITDGDDFQLVGEIESFRIGNELFTIRR